MLNAKYISLLTATVSAVCGLALFGIAWAGVRAAIFHVLHGDLSKALIVGAMVLAAFLACLIFVMSGMLRQFVELSARPHLRGPIRFGASLVLLTLLLGSAVAQKRPEALLFGFLPRDALFPMTLIFAVLFCVVFIYPGLAYPKGVKAPPRVVVPRPQIVNGPAYLPPVLRGALRIVSFATLLLGLFAAYAFLLGRVIPDPEIIEANRKYLPLSALLASLPLCLLIATQPITNGRTLIDHLRAKGPLVLVFVVINGLICIALPERGLPILANAVLDAKPETRSYRVVSAKPRSGLRFCGAKVVIELDPATGRRFDLCHMPVEIAKRAMPGDELYFHGKSAGFGLTPEGITLLSVQGGAAPGAVPKP